MKMRDNAPLVAAAEKQGFRVKPTKKGWLIFGKTGTPVCLHRTPTCSRAKANAMADLKKIGVEL
jgi:hypothetical protein